MTSIAALAPGRVCLFGEHQDYLGLPVVAVAIPLHCKIEVTEISTAKRNRVLELHVPALQQTFTYNLDELPPRQNASTDNPDFALAAVHEALDDGWEFQYGAVCTSTTEIPMQSGCSSSTAFCIAWYIVLAKLAGREEEVKDPLRLARLAHKAEVLHFGAPGGTMDHVSICYGKCCLRIGPGMWDVQELPPLSDADGVWVLADSGQKKDTMGHLKRCKYERLELLEEIGGSWTSAKTMDPVKLGEAKMKLLNATLTNLETEAEASKLWLDYTNDPSRHEIGPLLGSLMLRHHAALRDGLGLSTPRLESMLESAISAGAWGFKLVGSGGGGCAVAWSPKDKATNVAKAMTDAGATNTWIVQRPAEGARLQ